VTWHLKLNAANVRSVSVVHKRPVYVHVFYALKPSAVLQYQCRRHVSIHFIPGGEG